MSIIDHSADNDVRLLYLKSRYLTDNNPQQKAQNAFDQKILDLNCFDFKNEGPSFREFAQTLVKADLKVPVLAK